MSLSSRKGARSVLTSGGNSGYLLFVPSQVPTVQWTFLLLVCVGAGGVLGCLAVMLILNAKDLIAWEIRQHGS